MKTLIIVKIFKCSLQAPLPQRENESRMLGDNN